MQNPVKLRPIAAITAVLLLSTSAYAEEERYDKKLEATIIAKLGEKIGPLRESINFDDTAAIVSQADMEKWIANQNALAPKKIWVAPKAKNELPPVVSNHTIVIDPVVTATTQKQDTPRRLNIIWEKFDKDGNPIE